MPQNIFSLQTLIPVGAVAIVLSAAFSYGIMYNDVQTLKSEVAMLREDIKDLTAAVNRLSGSNVVTYGGPNSH